MYNNIINNDMSLLIHAQSMTTKKVNTDNYIWLQ